MATPDLPETLQTVQSRNKNLTFAESAELLTVSGLVHALVCQLPIILYGTMACALFMCNWRLHLKPLFVGSWLAFHKVSQVY